jgi:hypothetical protein
VKWVIVIHPPDYADPEVIGPFESYEEAEDKLDAAIHNAGFPDEVVPYATVAKMQEPHA